MLFFYIVIFKIRSYSEENTKIRKKRERHLKDIRKIRISLDLVSRLCPLDIYVASDVSSPFSKGAMIIVLRHAIERKTHSQKSLFTKCCFS